ERVRVEGVKVAEELELPDAAPGTRWVVVLVEDAAPDRVAALLQEFLADPGHRGSRLVVATRSGVAVDATDEVDPAAATVWGLVRAMQAEHPDRLLLADFDAVAEIDFDALADGGEWQVAVRGDEIRVPRLVR